MEAIVEVNPTRPPGQMVNEWFVASQKPKFDPLKGRRPGMRIKTALMVAPTWAGEIDGLNAHARENSAQSENSPAKNRPYRLRAKGSDQGAAERRAAATNLATCW